MKWALSVLGVVLALVGVTFALQGSGVVPVGGMANHVEWAYIGAVLVVAGVGAIWFGWRPQKKQG